MRNTAECKKFLVGILATNPSFLLERIGDLPVDAIAKIVANAANVNQAIVRGEILGTNIQSIVQMARGIRLRPRARGLYASVVLC